MSSKPFDVVKASLSSEFYPLSAAAPRLRAKAPLNRPRAGVAKW